jgi:hypothetical protein
MDVRAMGFNSSRDDNGNPLYSTDDYEFAPYMGLTAPRVQREAFDAVVGGCVQVVIHELCAHGFELRRWQTCDMLYCSATVS